MDTTALRRKAMADALAMGITDPIQGDGSGMDWLQGLVRGGEAYFKTKGAREERETEAATQARELAQAMEDRQRKRQLEDYEMNKPVGVSPGEALVNPQTGEQIYQAPDTSSTGPIRAVEGNSEVVLYDTRTGEEVGRRPIAPRPVSGRSQQNIPPLPPGFNIVTRR
jgi:hypothetical protein